MTDNTHAKARPALLSGGCLCGAVRYEIYSAPVDANVCHCRMCQQVSGSAFGAFAHIDIDQFAWVAEMPVSYRSSSIAERSFCAACGATLSYRFLTGRTIDVTLSSLDDRSAVAPRRQTGMESKVAWLDNLAQLPGSKCDAAQEVGGE